VAGKTTFTQKMADAICERITDGESLRAICRDEGMPATSTVCKWLAENPIFSEQYARAREAQADAIFDDILDIADNGKNDWMEREGQDAAGWQLNGEHIQRSRIRIDARKWMAGKLAPKKYGEKVVNEHSAPGGGPIQTSLTVSFVRPGNADPGD
jgi:hypothetical protein